MLTDVDGTLVTVDKVLTTRAVAAVRALRAAGIRFAIASGRPPRGMAMYIDALALDTPIAGFNGGQFVNRDLTIIEQKIVPPEVVRQSIALFRKHGLDPWIYRGNDWLVSDRNAPHVAREAWTVKFDPTMVTDVDAHVDQVAKVVGVSDDLDCVQQCERAAQAAFGDGATARRSQPYYLDVTHRDANKGAIVRYLAATLGIPTSEIATLGDQPTDLPMFKESGFSIAMGNAPDDVKAHADATTDSYSDDGFAKAIERFILHDLT